MAVAALVAAVALIAAGPARANNDFKNGFEDQLGRIAAFGAVNLGLQILTGGYYPVVPVAPVVVAPVVQGGYYAPSYGAYYGPSYAAYYGPSYGAYYGPSYGAYYAPHYGPRKVVVKYPNAYRHGQSWNSGYYRAPHHGYYGNRYGYNHGSHYNNRYDNHYDNDRGHRSHGKQHGNGQGNGHGNWQGNGPGNGHGRNW